MTETVLWALLQQSVLLSVAVLVLRAARPLLRRGGAGLTYAAWSLVPVLMVTTVLPRPSVEPVRIALSSASAPAAAGLAWGSVPPPLSTTPWLALWLAGTLVVLGIQVWRQWRLVRLGDRLPAGSSPALVGLLRPRIALPTDFDNRFTSEERELILAHEAVHRERLDNLWNLLAALAVALHWWNPLAWWGARRMQADQELACDAAVLASRPASRSTYAQALMAAHSLRPEVAPVASRWTSSHPLVERIAMLNHPVRASRRSAMLLACALATCAGLAWAGQPEDAVPVNSPGLKLSVVLAQQQGDRVNRLSFAMAGRAGERMRMENPGDGSDARPPMALELTARVLEPGKVQVDAVLWQGRPLAVVAKPRVVVKLNEPGMVEQLEPGTNSRMTLVVVPSLFERP
jgi:beta-lactamase regulating signal transducer with metallopeptidase domain